MRNLHQFFATTANDLLAEVALEGDPAPEGYQTGVALAVKALSAAVETGWDPVVDPMPASPDGLDGAVEEGFRAFCVTVDALVKKETKH